MKKQFFCLLMISISISLSAKDRVINNPYYEVSSSGITHITKIVLKDSQTRVHIHFTIIPNWSVKFSKKHFIKDSKSGEKFYATALIGSEFDKEIRMEASGDSSFILIFPALSKTISHIDFGEDEKTIIFGISLDAKQKKVQQERQVPLAAQQWIQAELTRAKVKTLVDYASPNFFSHDTARLVGYIKGYDPRLDFNTGMIYSDNILTREDSPVIVRIHEDGRFEADIPLVHPKYTSVVFKHQWIKFYIEPGQTLGMLLNWDDFLVSDRLPNTAYIFQDVQFEGPSAQINKELFSVKWPKQDYMGLEKSVKTLNPEQFKMTQIGTWQKGEHEIEDQIKTKNLSQQTQTILRNEVAMSNAAFMFEYVMKRASERQRDKKNEILKVKPDSSYYNFLQLLKLNDQSLLIVPSFSVFINRFEFSSPFMGLLYNRASQPNPTLDQYLFTELKLIPSQDDLAYFGFVHEANRKLNTGINDTEKEQLRKELNNRQKIFNKKYQSQIGFYEAKYSTTPKPLSKSIRDLQTWHRKDSVVANYYKLKPNFVYEVAKVRSLKHSFEQEMTMEEASLFLPSFQKGITNSFLIKEANRIFNKSYPLVPLVAYNLPSGRATEIFHKIIDPYKGEMLFIDFWGIFCGPCIGSIKSNKGTREKYKDSNELEFIFITSADDSPLDRYNVFVKEQQLVNTHRLSADDYRYLRQLFKFNGIPRYVVVNKQGQISNDNFQMHNFENELKQLLTKE